MSRDVKEPYCSVTREGARELCGSDHDVAGAGLVQVLEEYGDGQLAPSPRPLSHLSGAASSNGTPT